MGGLWPKASTAEVPGRDRWARRGGTFGVVAVGGDAQLEESEVIIGRRFFMRSRGRGEGW